MLRVPAARAAELLDLELLGLRALVLVGHVVVALAVLTAELDEVSHGASFVRTGTPVSRRTLIISGTRSTRRGLAAAPCRSTGAPDRPGLRLRLNRSLRRF